MSERSVTVWDPPITATVFEVGEGPPVLYLHGGGGITRSDPFMAALAATGHRVVAPRHPGFADPDELEELRDVHDLALYHDELLDALELEAVPVVGHSFGGMVAAEYAAHYPRRVSRLVLIAPVGLWNDEYPTADLFTAFPFAINDLLWADASSPEATAAMAAMAADGGEDDADPVTSLLLRVLPGLITLGKYMWPLPDKGLDRRLRRISAPSLVLWGEKDKLAPSRYADDFVAKIPDARAGFVPDAGHMVHYERAARCVELVSDVLG